MGHLTFPTRSKAILAIALVGACTVTTAFAQTADRNTGAWDPFVISAHIPTDRVLFTGTEYYGPYSGRSIEMREGLLGGTPRNWLYLWGGSQRFVIKGRASNSRMRLSGQFYGFRAQVKKPNDHGDFGVAVQFEANDTTDASIYVGRSRVTYGGTESYSLSAQFDHSRGFASRGGILQSSNNGDGQAIAVYGGIVKELPDVGNLTFRGQAELVAQGWRSALDRSQHSLEIKPILNGSISYRLTRWASLQGEATLMPAGVPYFAGHLTGLGSFLFYQPGGVAAELRDHVVGYGGLHLLLHWER